MNFREEFVCILESGYNLKCRELFVWDFGEWIQFEL